jgi:Cytochrome C'
VIVKHVTLWACGVGALVLCGCNSRVGQTPAAQRPASAPDLAVPPALSINAEMVSLVDHAAHALWDVEKEGHAPKTDQDWEEIEHHAEQLTAAGTLITLGGTGQADAGWVKSPDWEKYAMNMTDAATLESRAAHAKDFTALVKANSRLTDTCEGCHKQFKPELPTEGIVHPHYRK